MIVLDTNVLSALVRDEPDPIVAHWVDRQPVESVWVTVVTVYEVRFGIEILAPGRKRQRIEKALDVLMQRDLEGRVLSFDTAAAEAAAAIGATQRRRGRPIEVRDLYIGAITAVRKATLATRNTRHFEGIGLSLVDPWSA